MTGSAEQASVAAGETAAAAPSRLTRLAPGDAIAVDRGRPVGCIPVFGQHELVVRGLGSVLAHTPADVPILVADGASPERETELHLEQLGAGDGVRHALFYLRHERNLGFVENVNAAFAVAAPGDVVLLNSDCEVGPDWVERLRDA